MPVYEFRCGKCGTVFSEIRRMGDFTPGKCTSCGSDESEKVLSGFSVSSGSGPKPGPGGGCGGGCSCCH